MFALKKPSAAFHNYAHESVHPKPIEGWPPRSWFDKLTTNGYVTVIVKRLSREFNRVFGYYSA